MVIPPGITSLWKMNPLEEWLFRRKISTMNPSGEGNSSRNHQLMDADSDWQDQNAQKILRAVTIPA
jgi:hypothetical protein